MSGNSIGYRGNPSLFGLRARQIAQQEAEYAAAVARLAEAEAAAKEATPALVAAGVVVPVRRRPAKATSATSAQE